MRRELENWYPALVQMRLGTFGVTALDVSAHDSAAYVRVTVSFHADGHEPWITAGVSSDMNQAALMAIVDGFNYWLLKRSKRTDAKREIQRQFDQSIGESTPSMPIKAP
jgi:2-isopropylmalate synthase